MMMIDDVNDDDDNVDVVKMTLIMMNDYELCCIEYHNFSK